MLEETVVVPVETTPAPSPESEVTEDFVTIGGVKRPLKNFMAEISRKTKEEVMEEIRRTTPASAQPVSQSDWNKQVVAMAEKEMEETGSIVPVNTILNLIAQGTTYHLGEHNKTLKNAQKTLKDVRKELKGQYKDFGDYADEFDAIIEDIDPRQISKDGLKIVFDSLRGKRLDDILKKRDEEAAKKPDDTKILGEVGRVSAMVSTGVKTKNLTSEQKKEMMDMGFETEEDYLGRLEKRRQIAKSKGTKNIPDTLSELFKF